MMVVTETRCPQLIQHLRFYLQFYPESTSDSHELQ
jgi:hypothetical protein